MRASVSAFAALALVAMCTSASGQHATAYDVEDGKRVYEGSCANCHGPDGNVIAGIDFGRGVLRRAYTNEQLAAIVIGGIANTPMPPNPGMSQEQALRVVEYLRSMSAGRVTAGNGDAGRGRALVAGKGECLDCHAIRGEGSRVGPDLSRIGALRRAGELERSLLEPQAEIQAENRFYEVTTRSGATVKGRLLNRDTYTVQLLDLDERLRSFNIAELRSHGFAESPMPSARRKLSVREIDDIVSYLSTLRGETAP